MLIGKWDVPSGTMFWWSLKTIDPVDEWLLIRIVLLLFIDIQHVQIPYIVTKSVKIN